jgi:uncharacterized membrane protein
MKTYLLNLWDALRASYWFVPSLFALSALFLSFALPVLDSVIANSTVRLPGWILTTTDTGRSTLSAMAGAVLTVTGTVFSITVVTLSLTSQQFGPRLLRRFMYDLATQVTLGVFLSTGLYCLLLLRAVEYQSDGTSVPHLSILAAVASCVVSMALLIFFIHHVAMLIQAPHVVAAVAHDLNDAINRLFPEEIGHPTDREDLNHRGREQEERLGDNGIPLPSRHVGYVQAIDGEALENVARKHDCVITLHARPGDFVALDSPIADARFHEERDLEGSDREDLTTVLNDALIVGRRRTPRQDVECAVDELVEVAVRSLSAGINDPFTAVNCIDYLGSALSRLAQRKLPIAYRCDGEDRLRVIFNPVGFADVLDAAFNQIRQYGRDSVAVTIRLLEASAVIARQIQNGRDRDALLEHANMILRLSESFKEEHDRREVRERHDRVTELLNDSTENARGSARNVQ